MIADFKVLLDACVLANYQVCDLFLRLAESPRLFIPKWSQDILDEVHRTHTQRLGWDTKIADSFQEKVGIAFPDAVVDNYGSLIDVVTNDLKDRHVLAAAIRGKVDSIVTFNLKDFKDEHLEPWDLKADHPQDFLLVLYSLNSSLVMKRLYDISTKKKEAVEDTLIKLGKVVPAFSTKVLGDISS